MLRLNQRTLVGQTTAGQRSGVMIHPTQDLLLLYSVASDNAGEAYLQYCQEQIDKELPQNTLELHQLLDRCVATAERMTVELSLVVIAIIEDRVALAAYQGSVWLKRGVKVGQILSAEAALQILEGKTQADDVYVLLTKDAAALSSEIQDPLHNVTAKTAGTLIELPAVHESIQAAGMGLTVASIVDTEQSDEESSALHDATQPAVVTPEEVASALAEQQQQPVHPIKKVGKTVGTGFGFISRFYLGIVTELEQLFSSDVYVRQKHRRSVGKVLAVLVLILAVILAGFFFWRRNQAEQQKQVTATLQPYRQQLNALRDLSLQNPVAARQQLSAFIVELEAKSQEGSQPKFVRDALAVELESAKKFSQTISGQTELPQLPTFFDLRLVQSNFIASRIEVTPDTLFFLDSGQKKILALNIERKQPTILPIGEYPDIRALAANDEFLYFLGQGLFRFTLSGTEVASIVENSDDITNGGQSLGLFDKYLYVLNRDQNNIFRYDTEDDELDSKPAAWIKPGQGIDLNTVQSFAIDGDVWLSTQNGEIFKLTGGEEATFSISGLNEPFSSPITLFTKPDMQNLYVLEPSKKRMVVLDKQGQFVREVRSDELAGATTVVASEKQNKAFALSGSIVYEMGL